MNNNRLYLIILMVASVLIYQMAIVNPVIAQPSPIEAIYSPLYQLTPTISPAPSIGEEGSTTDPILLQIIILLGISAVLVIFIGVWINRRHVDSK